MTETKKGAGALKVYEGLPTWARGVVVVGGLAVTYIILSSVLKKLRADAQKKKAEAALNQSRAELQQQIDTGVAASYQKSVYNGFADAIATQFDGCDPSLTGTFGIGNDVGNLSSSARKVYDTILELNNDRDWLELVDSFGTRTYDACGWFMGNEENMTLYSAISSELSADEIAFLNKTLKQRSINYTV